MTILTNSNFVAPCCLVVALLFGLWAIFKSLALKNKQTSEFFLTAKNTQPWYRVAYGFYACSLGSSVMFSVVQFVVDKENGAGWLGLVCYSIFSGLPFILISYLGKKKLIQKVSGLETNILKYYQ